MADNDALDSCHVMPDGIGEEQSTATKKEGIRHLSGQIKKNYALGSRLKMDKVYDFPEPIHVYSNNNNWIKSQIHIKLNTRITSDQDFYPLLFNHAGRYLIDDCHHEIKKPEKITYYLRYNPADPNFSRYTDVFRQIAIDMSVKNILFLNNIY